MLPDAFEKHDLHPSVIMGKSCLTWPNPFRRKDVQLETQRFVQYSSGTFSATGYSYVSKPAVEVNRTWSCGKSEAI